MGEFSAPARFYKGGLLQGLFLDSSRWVTSVPVSAADICPVSAASMSIWERHLVDVWTVVISEISIETGQMPALGTGQMSYYGLVRHMTFAVFGHTRVKQGVEEKQKRKWWQQNNIHPKLVRGLPRWDLEWNHEFILLMEKVTHLGWVTFWVTKTKRPILPGVQDRRGGSLVGWVTCGPPVRYD